MPTSTSVSPSDLALAKEFVCRLAEQIDPQLFTVTLFGSRARGDADGESVSCFSPPMIRKLSHTKEAT